MPSFSKELAYPGNILVGVVLVGVGVVSVFGYPKGFRGGLGIVQLVNHVGGNKVVLIAMNEEHGVLALGNLPERRGFIEVPAVAQLAKQTDVECLPIVEGE